MSTSYQVQQLHPLTPGGHWVVVHDSTDLEKAQSVLSAMAMSGRVRLITIAKIRYPALNQKPLAPK